MSDLFAHAKEDAGSGPLADRMRPRTLDDVVGQDHIVGPGRLLRRSIQADRLSSILLYGPPGTGKTSLARVIANTTRSSFESLNAVLSGVKELREAIARAEERKKLYGKRTILFVDEVHRWNKAQQDALLPWVENGTVILVGATTENPFFEVNRALVSRSRIFQLTSLTREDLLETANRALADSERGYGKWQINFEEGGLEHLVEVANGDARSLLNALELAIETSPQRWPPTEGTAIAVSFAACEESIQRKAVLYDRDGDYHFDTISAFIKSIRGSDPDAALYWLAKMVRAGEDPLFIFRRMLISASEDVGLADPNAIVVVESCKRAFEHMGLPEGHFPLAQAALYLSTAPKSNTALAFFDALKEVEREDNEVPNHLRDDHRDKEGFGHGDGYVYPHAYREHWAAQQYLPRALTGRTFYIPSMMGYEGHIRDEVLRKRELQAAVVLGEGDDEAEILTYTATSRSRDGWYKRLESGKSAQLMADRDRIFEVAQVERHSRILIPGADDGLLLWESHRRAPEGLVAGTVRTEEAHDALVRYAQTLDESERPILTVSTLPLPTPDAAEAAFETPVFDRILARELLRKTDREQPLAEVLTALAASARALLSPRGSLVLLESIPAQGQRISALLERELLAGAGDRAADGEVMHNLAMAEDAFFARNGRWAWGEKNLAEAFEAAGFSVNVRPIDQREERLLTSRDIGQWFDREKSAWGRFIHEQTGEADFERASELLAEIARRGPLIWNWKALLVCAKQGAASAS